MKSWTFENGVVVEEDGFDADLHIFHVSHGERFLCDLFPEDVEHMESIKADLDAGKDPVSDNWEDGFGRTISFNMEDYLQFTERREEGVFGDIIVLENGIELFPDEWNGEEYTVKVDGVEKSYRPVQKYDAEYDQYDTVGYREF